MVLISKSKRRRELRREWPLCRETLFSVLANWRDSSALVMARLGMVFSVVLATASRFNAPDATDLSRKIFEREMRSRFHADRAPGRDRHHFGPGGTAAPSVEPGEIESPWNDVSKQRSTTYIGMGALCGRQLGSMC